MSEIEKLVRRTLAETYARGYARDDIRTVQAILGALSDAGFLSKVPAGVAK